MGEISFSVSPNEDHYEGFIPQYKILEHEGWTPFEHVFPPLISRYAILNLHKSFLLKFLKGQACELVSVPGAS